MTLFELKEKMATIKAAILADANWIAEKAADPSVAKEDLDAKKAHRDELQGRYDMLKAEHDRMEEEQRIEIIGKGKGKPEGMTEKEAAVKTKAKFYRDALSGNVSKSYEGLGAIPAANADLGNGDKLLPTNLSNQLLMEPVEVNPLRNIVHITNVTGLAEPKLGFTIEDADIADVTDKQTANEIAMEGDAIQYGRLKVKVKATVKDTVYYGADVDLVGAIENNLRSALAKREKHFAFLAAASCASDSTHAHMSFYNAPSSTPVIKGVEGATMYEAILNALADLADDYAANATVVMTKADYYGMIKELANNSDVLFTGKPASFLGYPVVFCDLAEEPVVGDFSYYGINYDIGAVYDTDKDVDKGEFKFVLTAWGDQQIRMKSAFRRAVVNP